MTTARKVWKPVDRLLASGGAALALAAAFLPWHVYSNPQAYGPPRMEFADGDATAEHGISERRLDMPRHFRLADVDVDRLVTGTIAPGPRTVTEQAMPVAQSYKVFFVSRGRALLHDGEALIVAAPGTLLPGGERVRALRETGSQWRVELDDGRELAWRQ